MAGPAQTTEVTLTTKPDAPRSHLDALVELATRKAAETVGLGGSDSRDTSARQAANFDGNSDASNVRRLIYRKASRARSCASFGGICSGAPPVSTSFDQEGRT